MIPLKNYKLILKESISLVELSSKSTIDEVV